MGRSSVPERDESRLGGHAGLPSPTQVCLQPQSLRQNFEGFVGDVPTRSHERTQTVGPHQAATVVLRLRAVDGKSMVTPSRPSLPFHSTVMTSPWAWTTASAPATEIVRPSRAG